MIASSRWSKLLLRGTAIIVVLTSWDPSLCLASPRWQSDEQTSPPTIFVIGRVKLAGEYRFVSGMTVADALSAAGGILPRGRSDQPVSIEIRRKVGDQLEVKSVKLSDRLTPNDIVAVGRGPTRKRGRQAWCCG
jgi:hypothetical protein